MPDPDQVPDEFNAELKAYFGNQESSSTRSTKGVVKQEAVVADIRSLMSRGNRGYYLVKSYGLDEMKAILFESCKQLNSLGLKPELVSNLESALQRNDSGEPKIRIITENYILLHVYPQNIPGSHFCVCEKHEITHPVWSSLNRIMLRPYVNAFPDDLISMYLSILPACLHNSTFLGLRAVVVLSFMISFPM